MLLLLCGLVRCFFSPLLRVLAGHAEEENRRGGRSRKRNVRREKVQLHLYETRVSSLLIKSPISSSTQTDPELKVLSQIGPEKSVQLSPYYIII